MWKIPMESTPPIGPTMARANPHRHPHPSPLTLTLTPRSPHPLPPHSRPHPHRNREPSKAVPLVTRRLDIRLCSICKYTSRHSRQSNTLHTRCSPHGFGRNLSPQCTSCSMRRVGKAGRTGKSQRKITRREIEKIHIFCVCM